VVLLGATFGAGQTLCFWESIKTLETSIAVLLFYTYPAVTLAIDRLAFRQRVRPLALLCVAAILCGAALVTGPGLHHGALDPRGLAWAVPAPPDLASTSRLMPPAGRCCCLSGSAPAR
jgi:drug/metabolite transporter (DMT)-like permease